MRSSTDKPWHAVVALTEEHHGLLRLGDLLALGYHPRHVRRLVLAGLVHQLHPGVYAVGHRAISRHAQFLAAVWWAGDDAAISHETGAAFYTWVPDELPDIHVSVPHARVRSKPGVVVHRVRRLDHHDVVVHDGLPVTDRIRTLVDLADHLSYEELRAVADELPYLPKAALARKAAGLPGRRGAARLQQLIISEDADARFAMERRCVRYFAAHGVPEPQRNVRVHGLFRVDCWYPDALLVLELDSRAHHTRRRELEADRLRDRALDREGVHTVRLVWRDLDPADPQAAHDVLQQLRVRQRATGSVVIS